jgi:ATP-dependent DNA helicase RecG
MTLDSLMSGPVSMPHNPLIANAFFRSGQIELWGRGVEKIINGCIADDLPEPEFDISTRMFSVCFHIRDNNNAITGADASNGIPSHDGIKDGIKDGINDIQKKMLALLFKNPDITTTMLAAELGINKRNTEKNMKALKNAGLVERLGSRKYGHWIVHLTNPPNM